MAQPLPLGLRLRSPEAEAPLLRVELWLWLREPVAEGLREAVLEGGPELLCDTEGEKLPVA